MNRGHWADQEELGGGHWQFRLMSGLFRLFGPLGMRIIVRPIALFFYLASVSRRKYSREFLSAVSEWMPAATVRRLSVHRHFQAFALSLVDKMAAWAGMIPLDGLDISDDDDFVDLVATLRRGQGVLAMCSHLGNVEILRALGSLQVEHGQEIPDFRVIAIVEFEGTGKFNDMLETIEEGSMAGILPVSRIGPDTIIRLQEFAASGGMIVIAGDRTPPREDGRFLEMDFMGRPARFPYGSYLLADLLELPVYTVFALRDDDTSLRSRYRFHVTKSGIPTGGSRRERDARIQDLAAFFRDRLQELAGKHPYQWFNFYPFWGTAQDEGRKD